MRTRSSRGSALYDDRETETDESSLTNLSSKRRKVSSHISSLHRNGLSKISNHLSHSIKRELENSRDTEKSSGTTVSPLSNSNDMYVNGSGSVDDKQSVRRSTRQRKFMYDNLNQQWLLASNIPEFSKFESLFSNDQRNPQVQPRRSERNRSYELRRLGLNPEALEFEDMYSRVKRKSRKSVHSFYSRRISQDAGSMADTEDTDQNGISDSETMDDHSDLERVPEGEFNNSMAVVGESQEDSVVHGPKYSLRPKRPITNRFQIPIKTTRPRRSTAAPGIFVASQNHHRSQERDSFKSTAHRNHIYRRKRHAIHSSSSSSSDDERRFENKKALSMARARTRCLPLNFIEDDLTKGVLRDRVKIGSSLADIDPMSIDKAVNFEHIGGLDKHIQSLKEMILFPLMYPEVFQRFKISPPRGVLFYGPPGTGKTLVARALANECSTGDKRVAFFMRKGADCLSKWVGESERQLRLLFDQAYSMRPSIIFFDEIDGLAPVRSTRQDQIHSSIVSTLLALMDGLDNRGEIVIIGATNRLDAIDPALRRPGRFDRELLFPLPSFQARHKILKIITQDWVPPQPDNHLSELASCTAGYCGADLKALCSEAALVALRRRYPQIYNSKQKLQLDVETIQVESVDFHNALKKMKPSVQRSTVVSAKPLSPIIKPLLENTLSTVFRKISKLFPYFENQSEPGLQPSETASTKKLSAIEEDSDDGETCLYQDNLPKFKNLHIDSLKDSSVFLDAKSHLSRLSPIVHRPYFLLAGKEGQGQGSVAPAVLYMLENISVHRLDIPALYAVTSRAPEEACAQIFHEAQRNLPSVIFLPLIGYWWETLSETVRATFLSLLQDLDPSMPLMLFATSNVGFSELPRKIQEIFGASPEQVFNMNNPTEEERKQFFSNLVKEIYKYPHKTLQKENVEILPIAPPPSVRKLTNCELNKVRDREEVTMRELRLFLRDILQKLARDRRFAVFARPVDPLEVPDYQEVIKNPMDLETMMMKIDLHRYETVAQFLSDIDLVCQNALDYNPDRNPTDKIIRHRAFALKDMAHAIVMTELDDEFEKICQEIQKSRQERGDSPSKFAPKRYQALSKTLSVSDSPAKGPISPVINAPQPIAFDCEKPSDQKENSETVSSPTRYSKRLRGMGAASVSTDGQGAKTFSPKRTSRYMLWRRKKSPWFGGCRRKLIRRKTKLNCARNKLKLINNPSQKFIKAIDPLHPTQEENKPSEDPTSVNFAIAKNSEEKRDSSGTDSSATIVSPKAVSAPCDLSLVFENNANAEPRPLDKSPGLTSPTSPSKKHFSCDISMESSARHMTLRSPPPPCTMILRSPPNRRQTVSSASSEPAVLMETDSPKLTDAVTPLSPPRKISINTANLERFILKVVKVTDGFTVEKLLQLYSYLQQCVYKHRKELDKKELLKDLESCLDSFLHHLSS